MQTIKPAAHQLFIRAKDAEKVTPSGFYLTEESLKKPQTATVINVGKEVKDYEKDDVIVYRSYTVSDIELNGDKYMLITDEDVLGTVLEIKE